MSFSLDYQKSLNTCILNVHRRAGIHTDPHVSLALLDIEIDLTTTCCDMFRCAIVNMK